MSNLLYNPVLLILQFFKFVQLYKVVTTLVVNFNIFSNSVFNSKHFIVKIH